MGFFGEASSKHSARSLTEEKKEKNGIFVSETEECGGKIQLTKLREREKKISTYPLFFKFALTLGSNSTDLYHHGQPRKRASGVYMRIEPALVAWTLIEQVLIRLCSE